MIEIIKDTNGKIRQFISLRSNRVLTLFFLLAITVMIVSAVNRVIIYASDFNMFIDPAIDARFHHQNPFVKWTGNSYNMFFYAFMSLLSPFNNWFAVIIWSLVSIYLYILAIAIMHRMLPLAHAKHKWYYLIAPVMLGFLLFDNIQLGQSNILMLFAVIASIYYVSKGKNLGAGLALGFAIAFKTTPLIFVGYYVLKGKFKAAAYSLIFSLFFMIVVPMLFYPPQKSLEYFRSWTEAVFVPFASGNDLKTQNIGYYHSNQSLEAFINRHFTSYGKEKYGGLHYLTDPANMTKIQAKTTGNIIKMVLLGLLSVLVLLNNRKRDPRFYLTESSLFLMAILWVSPSSWTNHYIILLPAVVLLVNEIIRLPKHDSKKKLLLVVLVAGTLLMLIDVHPMLQSFSLHFIGMFILFTGLLVYSFGTRKTPFQKGAG
jgi:hypothetical protein